MRFLKLLTITMSVSALAFAPSALTQQLPYPENSTFFTGQPPSLVNANTPDPLIGWPHPHYYFILNLPASSPQSLGKVTITPQANIGTITFNLSKTEAFQGTKNNKGQAITLQSVTQDSKTGVITIAFAPPIPPGTTFTITLQPFTNPGDPGTYLFTVQAFPIGENPIGLDIGVGSLSFYQLL